jgi:Glycosyltransferase family 25 (LPS biosynthesis protein)
MYLNLSARFRMCQVEIAVACSHIAIWKTIAQSSAPYSLVLEDDVRFDRGFGRILDRAWREMEDDDRVTPGFDILYVSYGEVRNGAPKELVSRMCFGRSGAFGICPVMYFRRRELRRCWTFFHVAVRSTSGSIISSESWTFGHCAAQ